MIRFLLVGTTVILFLILSIPLLLLEWIVGKCSQSAKDTSCLKIIQSVFHFILLLAGVKLTVTGRENIPKDRAVLYVSNHRSYFDIVIGYTLVKGRTGFVAKKEMEKIPLLSHWMRNLNCLFLDRDNLKEGLKTVLQAIANVKNGKSVWICPEGTRHQGEGMLPFREGSFKIAEKAACPVIPVAFSQTDDIYENHSPFIRRTHAAIQFGKPIEVSELTKEEKRMLGHQVQEEIMALLQTAAVQTS